MSSRSAPWAAFLLASVSGLALTEDRGVLPAADLFRDSASAAPATPSAGGLDIGVPLTSGPVFLGLGGDGGMYAEAKAGPIWFFNDLEKVSQGYDVEAVIGFRIIPLVFLEGFTGYFRGEDTGSIDATLWGVPIGINVRVDLPIPLVKPYVGLGGAMFYVHTDATGAGSQEDWEPGIDAFVGTNFELGPFI